MKTKVSVLGEAPKKELKPIEFKLIGQREIGSNSLHFEKSASMHPHEHENLMLIQTEFAEGLDLIVAYNDFSNSRMYYLGHWNDGVVAEPYQIEVRIDGKAILSAIKAKEVRHD